MKRQLGLFQEQRSRPVQNSPKQTDQSECSIRKLFFRLPRTLWAPVFVLTSQMWGCPNRISPELEILQLRHSDLERFKDPSQPGITCLCRAQGNLFEEIAAIWIILVAHGTIRLSDELGNYM